MKAFTHQQFLTESNMEHTTLSQPMQKKMELFAELVEEMKKITGEDQKKLKHKILELDEELYEDLLNEFDDELENNEIIERKAPVKKQAVVSPTCLLYTSPSPRDA